jgi:putative transposase
MFLDDQDRTAFCNRLAGIVQKRDWLCHAFCLMTTHYHLLMEVRDNELQCGMQALNGPYAQGFNARHGRTGHLRGDRYDAKPIESDGHMLHTVRYIARNPVEAGLCRQPSDWIWGSYRGCAGIDAGFQFVDSSRIRAYFGATPESACALLRVFAGDLATVS